MSRARTIAGVGVATALLIAGVAGVRTLFSQRTANRPALDTDEPIDGLAAESQPGNRRPTPDEPRRRSEPRDRWSSQAGPAVHVDIPNVYRALKATTKIAATGSDGLGVEAQANATEPFMIGMIEAIRAIDPNILTGLRDVYADEMCGKAEQTPAQIMVYAKAVLFEARLGSGRGLECALKRNPQEDVVTWSLLDAWDNAGQEPLPVIATIGASAKDERTLRRLNPEQARARRLAAGMEAEAAHLQGAAETTITRATNTDQ